MRKYIKHFIIILSFAYIMIFVGLVLRDGLAAAFYRTGLGIAIPTVAAGFFYFLYKVTGDV